MKTSSLPEHSDHAYENVCPKMPFPNSLSANKTLRRWNGQYKYALTSFKIIIKTKKTFHKFLRVISFIR